MMRPIRTSMRSSNGCIWPMPGASGATSCNAPSATRGLYHDFLTLLITEEIAHRQQTRLGV